MTIGRITVDLLARTGSFETDLNRAAKHAERRAKEIDAAVSKVGVAVGAALSSAGIAAVYFGKQFIDGLDALNDFKDATGASIANLSALEDVAVRTGTNMDNVSGILVKFNNVLKEVDGKNEASQILKKLGLDAEELKRIDPAEALRQTAVALTTFADDGDKARAVQTLFGKSVKEAAPFLKDLAEQTSLVGKVTAEQAQAAEDFNKQLFALQKGATDLGRSVLKDLLPGMTQFLQNMRDIAALGGTWLAVRDAAVGFLDPNFAKMSGNNGADIKQFMRERERLQKDLEFATRKGFATRGIEDSIAENAKFLEIVRAKQRNEVAPLFGEDFGDAVSRRMAPKRSIGGTTRGGGGSKKAPKDKDSEFEKYIENLQRQIDKTKELGVAETVLADIRSGQLGKKVSKAQEELAIKKAKELHDIKALAEYTKLAQAAEQTRSDALLKTMLDQEAQAKALTDGNQSLKDEIELIGKSAEAQAAIQQARIDGTVALLEEKLERLRNTDAYARETEAIEAQITALKERKDLVALKGVADQLKEDAEEAKDFAKQVGAAFSSSFEKAILDGGKLGDMLKGLAKDVLGLYIRNSITGPMAKAIGEFGGGGGGFDFGSILSSIGSLFGGIFGGGKAGGGPVSNSKMYMVGENGPELFVPNTAGKIVPNHALGGGGSPVYVTQNFTVGDVAGISTVRDAVANSEKRIAGMIGRSQRYGGSLA